MAESVEYAMGYIAEEIDEMRRIGLFTEEKLKDITRKWRDFEYKRHSVIKRLEYFVNYISFIHNMLKLVRRNRTKLKIQGRRGNIENSFIDRINRLYGEALMKFSDNYDLCVDRFNFCKSVNNINAATAAIDFILKHHQSKEASWNLAATWYAKCGKNVKEVLEILLKGIVLNPTSKILYKQILSLELSNAQRTLKQSNNIHDKRVDEKVKLYFSAVFKAIKDLDFYFELLRLFDSYSFTTSMKKLVIEHLTDNYAEEPNMWITLAQRELAGLNDNCREISEQERFKLSSGKFEEGLQKLPQSKKPELWAAFIDQLAESYKTKISSGTEFETYLQKAHNEGCLSEMHYDYWLKLSRDQQVESVFKKAVEAHPQSGKLWKLYLTYKIIKEHPEGEVRGVFDKGVAVLKEKALPLYIELIKYYLINGCNVALDNLYKRGIAIESPHEISHILAPEYIKWLTVTCERNIGEARKVYDEISTRKPYCKKLHTVMASLEHAEEDLTRWEKVVKLATKQFPDDLDVWSDCMDFFKYYKINNADLKETYKKAISVLPDIKKMQFQDKYSFVPLE